MINRAKVKKKKPLKPHVQNNIKYGTDQLETEVLSAFIGVFWV